MLRYLAVGHAANGIAVGLINQKIGKAWDQRTEGSGLQVLKDFEEAPADKVQKVAREIRADLEQMFEVGPLDCADPRGFESNSGTVVHALADATHFAEDGGRTFTEDEYKKIISAIG